jgi:NAD(P)H-flavin reductase
MKKEIFESRLLYKKYLTEDLLIVGFEADLDFKAGQFFHIIIDKDNPDDENIGFRPYSILNSPDDSKSRKIIESFIKLIPGGLGSDFINNLEVGETVFLRGAFGRFQLDKNNDKHVFLCIGTGITPVNSIIEQNINSENELTVLHGAKIREKLLYYEKFRDLKQKHDNFHYFATLTRNESPDWGGLTGRLTEHMELINDFSDKTVYICGVKDFIIDALALVKDKAKNIIIERYN